MTDFYIKRNDTSPTFRATLVDADGAAVNVTGAAARLHMSNEKGVKVDAAMTLDTPLSGIVTYAWQVADTDTAGFYDAEIEVTFSDSTVQTFPNNGYWTVHVDGDLA